MHHAPLLVFGWETVTVEVILLPSTFCVSFSALLLQSLQANGMLTCSKVKMHGFSVLISTKPCSRAWSALGLTVSMFWNPTRQMTTYGLRTYQSHTNTDLSLV